MDRTYFAHESPERKMVRRVMSEFDHIPMFEYNEWCVKQLVEVEEDGVTTRIVLFLRSDSHGESVGIILHPRAALKMGADIVLVAAHE